MSVDPSNGPAVFVVGTTDSTSALPGHIQLVPPGVNVPTVIGPPIIAPFSGGHSLPLPYFQPNRNKGNYANMDLEQTVNLLIENLEKLEQRVMTLEVERGLAFEEERKLRQRVEALEALAPQPFDRILKDITEKEQST